jgi:hypothetical protein
MKLKPQYALLITLIIIIAGVVFSSAAGLFDTKSSKEPEKMSEAGYEDSYDPGDIRGSYTFTEISSLYGIPLEDLMTAFILDKGDVNEKIGELGAKFESSEAEIGTASVRLFVAYYLDVPYDLTEEVFLPASAVELLISRGSLDSEQTAFLESHSVS